VNYAKTMTFLVIGALSAGSAPAVDTPWFDARIDTYQVWPTNDASFGGTWSTNAAAVAKLDNDLVVFDAESDDPLKFEAATPKVLGTDAKTIEVNFTADFIPFPPEELPVIPATAKAGVITVSCVSSQLFYVVLFDGVQNAWTNTGVKSEMAANDVSVQLVTNGTDLASITYVLGKSRARVSGLMRMQDATVRAACFSGSGGLASLAAAYDSYTVPLDPGTNTVVVVADSAEAAMAQVDIAVPNDPEVQAAVSDPVAYKAMFAKSAKSLGGGRYEVTVVFNPNSPTVQELQETVDDETRNLDLATVAGGSEGSATINPSVPGVFYVLESGEAPTGLAPSSEQVGDGGPVMLTMPSHAGKGFYRLVVSPSRKLNK